MSKIRYSKIFTCALLGIDGVMVDIEVSIHPGLSVFEIVGLGDCAIRESRNRIRAAIKYNGYDFPPGRIIVGMAPAFVRKGGTAFDLPIALGILAASTQIAPIPKDVCIIGEMSLSGDIRGIPGTINRIITSSQKGFHRMIIPYANLKESSLIHNIQIYAAGTLSEVIAWIQGTKKWKTSEYLSIETTPHSEDLRDISAIIGQPFAVRALIIAAVGKHHLLYIGGPGCGKTTLAGAMPGILPQPDQNEKIEMLKIYSSCGLTDELLENDFCRPFRAPHHNTTLSAITGGGGFPVPGEITLAHSGVLFLDEMNEFSKDILEQLRKPLEEQRIIISRCRYTMEYPADFILIGAANPCACGNLLERDPANQCTCSYHTIRKYHDHISGPLFDRIDLYVQVFKVSKDCLAKSICEKSTQTSENIRKRVKQAWDKQKSRCIRNHVKVFFNSRLPCELMTRIFELDDETVRFSTEIAGKMNLTVRGYHKMIRIARSIADYENDELINKSHIAQAIQFRRK